jgi:hypothetical protein
MVRDYFTTEGTEEHRGMPRFFTMAGFDANREFASGAM